MRMDIGQELTAREIVNCWSEEEIGAILKEYGEERYWKRIARSIVSARRDGVVDTTDKLTGIVLASVPGAARRQPIHPSTRVFQALRIAVNGELTSLEKALPKVVELLKPDGRFAIISYHSLEDRIVKRAFAALAKGCICPPDFPVCKCGRKPTVQLITRRVVRAGNEEVRSNPRARSAKMRVCERHGSEEQRVFAQT
jgi:16S rRNA (cytosine1402-N4)-methyltransferase